MDAQQIWMRKTDGEVLAAAANLHEYTEEGDRTIRAELLRRGLSEAAPPVGLCDACGRSIPASHPTSIERSIGNGPSSTQARRQV